MNEYDYSVSPPVVWRVNVTTENMNIIPIKIIVKANMSFITSVTNLISILVESMIRKKERALIKIKPTPKLSSSLSAEGSSNEKKSNK